MQGTKVMKAVFLAIQSSNPQSMVESAKAVSESIGCDVWVNVYEYSALNEDPLLYDDLLRRSKEADFIYIRVMSDPTRFKRFNDYVSIVKNTSALIFLYSGNIDVTTMNRELFRADDADFKSFVVYAAHRGPHNDQGMLWMAAKHLGLTDLQPPDPQDPRDNGIYHPDRKSVV
mgnify:CR=1 FL=1